MQGAVGREPGACCIPTFVPWKSSDCALCRTCMLADSMAPTGPATGAEKAAGQQLSHPRSSCCLVVCPPMPAVILNSNLNMLLPNLWLWDMVDEFVYQFQSFCQYR